MNKPTPHHPHPPPLVRPIFCTPPPSTSHLCCQTPTLISHIQSALLFIIDTHITHSHSPSYQRSPHRPAHSPTYRASHPIRCVPYCISTPYFDDLASSPPSLYHHHPPTRFHPPTPARRFPFFSFSPHLPVCVIPSYFSSIIRRYGILFF